jgi:cyclopropane fatty-acyl-phospholipid synthase-like methyltransferase
MVHRFENADHWAKIFDEPHRDDWQKPADVVGALALAPGMTVVDIGAGTGYFEKRLADAVGADGRVLALDVEPDMIRYLRERAAREGTPNVEARVVRTDDPELAPASVDRVLIVDTWHHVGGREAYAGKLATALRPGGMVAVVDFTMESPMGPPRHHRLRPEQIAHELEAGGLHASVSPVQLPNQYIVIGAK